MARIIPKFITCEEMNQVLEEHKGFVWKFGAPDGDKNINKFRQCCYIVEKMIEFNFICYDKGSVIHYKCYKDGRTEFPQTSGGEAWSNYRHYKGSEVFPVIVDKEKDNIQWPSASPLIGFNPEYSGQRQDAYCYDLNSAYSYAMTHTWIDTSNGPAMKEIEEGKEIGFSESYAANGEFIYKIKRKGWSNMVFPIAPVPECNKRYVENWYAKKKAAKNWQDKAKAKGSLNYLIGEWQNKNPYLRLLIVCSCNEFIESLIDENTLFYNTDSIVSRVRRPDIEANLGDNIGQWKIEHLGEVAYKGNTYQWNDDLPVVRGKAKNWFKRYIQEHGGWDLLLDKYPDSSYNAYVFDEEQGKLVEVNDEEETKN